MCDELHYNFAKEKDFYSTIKWLPFFLGQCRFTEFNFLASLHCLIDDPGCKFDSECSEPTWKCCKGPCRYKECLPSTVSPSPQDLQRQQERLQNEQEAEMPSANIDDVDVASTDNLIAEHELPSTQRVSEQELPPTQQISEQELPPTQRASEQELSPTQQLSEHELPPTQQVSEQELPPNQQVSEQELPPTHRVSEQERQPTHRVSEQERPPTQQDAEERLPNQRDTEHERPPTQQVSEQERPLTRQDTEQERPPTQRVSEQEIRTEHRASNQQPPPTRRTTEEWSSTTQINHEARLPARHASEREIVPAVQRNVQIEQSSTHIETAQHRTDTETRQHNTHAETDPSFQQMRPTMVAREESMPAIVDDPSIDPSSQAETTTKQTTQQNNTIAQHGPENSHTLAAHVQQRRRQQNIQPLEQQTPQTQNRQRQSQGQQPSPGHENLARGRQRSRNTTLQEQPQNPDASRTQHGNNQQPEINSNIENTRLESDSNLSFDPLPLNQFDNWRHGLRQSTTLPPLFQPLKEIEPLDVQTDSNSQQIHNDRMQTHLSNDPFNSDRFETSMMDNTLLDNQGEENQNFQDEYFPFFGFRFGEQLNNDFFQSDNSKK